MIEANGWVDEVIAGKLQKIQRGSLYRFTYLANYKSSAVSLTMPTTELIYEFDRFPPFFEGLLPEKKHKTMPKRITSGKKGT